MFQKYIVPYIGTVVVVLVVLAGLTLIAKNATGKKFTAFFGY